MANHTPGPWGLFDETDIWPTEVDGSIKYGGGYIARMRWRGDRYEAADGVSRFPETEANARLIAAAPDLLEMVKENYQKRHDYGMWIARLEAQRTRGIIASHTNPIEECASPGCMKNRAVISAAEGEPHMLIEKTLSFDWFDAPQELKGWSDNRSYNGWAVPLLDFETSVTFSSMQNAERARSRGASSGLARIWYRRSDDAFYVFEDDYAADDDEYEPVKIEGKDVDGKHLYDWGDLGWVWEWEE